MSRRGSNHVAPCRPQHHDGISSPITTRSRSIARENHPCPGSRNHARRLAVADQLRLNYDTNEFVVSLVPLYSRRLQLRVWLLALLNTITSCTPASPGPRGRPFAAGRISQKIDLIIICTQSLTPFECVTITARPAVFQ